MPPTTVFTIGHSRHVSERFLELLRTHSIERLVDVRSQPYSKWSPHFDKKALAQFLDDRRLQYVFLGPQLGGRPEGRVFYRADGSVDYALRSQAPDFRDGIDHLLMVARGGRTVILCAEEDPERCHRRLLVAPALQRLGAEVVHVRGDARLEPEAREPDHPRQLDLFGGGSKGRA